MSCINLCCGEKTSFEKNYEILGTEEVDSDMLSQPLQKTGMGGSSGSGGFSCSGEMGSGITSSTVGTTMEAPSRNPMLCLVCDNYYTDPCLLVCYHTFCARCVQGREMERKIMCPLCGVPTALKDGQSVPPVDMLMRQLIDLTNSENPPCANCDKRDKNNMHFCVTCGQALCTHCRENTHKAKMFASHEVLHMSKCSKESYRKQCLQHGEPHILFSNSQRTMLCNNCIQDMPPETRVHCVDIDTAYNQGCKKLDRAITTINGMQSSVRDGLILFKNLLDELRQNVETERNSINSFCEGMRQTISKTQASVLLEVQRQFESKECNFQGQLTNLGSMLPLLQLHLLLAQTFTISANKYQFLDLAYPMMDRLNAVSQLSLPLSHPIQSSQIRTNFRGEFAQALDPWVGKVGQGQAQEDQQPRSSVSELRQQQSMHYPLKSMQQQPPQHYKQQPCPVSQSTPSRRQQNVLRRKALEGEGLFSNHCRSFDNQLKELESQLGGVRERLGELHRDVTLLRRAHTPPLTIRYETVTRDCTTLEQALQCRQAELERLQGVFHTLWEEQICRVSVEREIFQAQINEVVTLAAEVKNIASTARQLEPYVVALSAAERIAMSQIQSQHTQTGQGPSSQSHQPQGSSQKASAEDTAHLQAILDHFLLQQAEKIRGSGESGKGECSVHTGTSPGHSSTPAHEKLLYLKLDGKQKGSRGKTPRDLSERRDSRDARDPEQQALQSALESGYAGRESKRTSVLSQIIGKVRTKEERKKSPEQEMSRAKTPTRERGKFESRGDGSRGKCSHPEEHRSKTKSPCEGFLPVGSACKVASLYHSLSGKVLGSSTHSIQAGADEEPQQLRRHLPPPPPPQRRPTTQITSIPRREREDTSPVDIPDGTVRRRSRLSRPASAGEKDDGEFPVTRKSKSCGSPTDAGLMRALVHREPLGSQPASPRRHRSTDSALRQIRMYPASDTEESAFKQSSCESLVLSDIGIPGDHRKTVIVVVGPKSQRHMQKQRSWETFPPKRRDGHKGRFCHDPEVFRSGFPNGSPPGSTMSHIGPSLKKADSFEGHEEAVATLVAAVHETRSQSHGPQSQPTQQQQHHHHQRKHTGPKTPTPGSGSG